MGANGKRNPPRPRIELLTGAASDSEAAAIVAAVEQFIADTAPEPAPQGTRVNHWLRAALREGVTSGQLPFGPQGDDDPWGR